MLAAFAAAFREDEALSEPRSHGAALASALLVPFRKPGSVRRTSTTDMLRPQGSPGPIVLAGRVRDLVTQRSPDAREVGAAEVFARVGVDGRIEELRCTPDLAAARALIGARVRSGFRSQLEQLLPAERESCAPLYHLLDELPVAAMITGYAIVRDARASQALRNSAAGIRLDVCSGWRSDGEIARRNADGASPSVPLGAPAPSLERADDPLAWHVQEPLPPGSMRRRRRLDLIPGEPWIADAMLRDVFVERDGSETILHEYRVEARLDPRDLRVLELRAAPGVLPSADCHLSIESRAQIPAIPATELRRYVSENLKGPTTCTHLNDVFRSLSDAAALRRALA